MPSTAAPSLYNVAFELGIYAAALYVLVALVRARRADEIPWMLAAMVFAGAIERADIRSTHAYYYTDFLVMLGEEPDWFPLAIAVAWGLVLYTVTAATARLPISPWLRPWPAALLAVLIDLVLDPVVADARLITQLGQVCDAADLPHGNAHGIGLWVWCVLTAEPNLIWGIPFANFFAWGVVVLGYIVTATVLRDAFDGERGGFWRQAVLASATGLAAFCIVDVVLQLYTPLVLEGVPEWALLALVFAPGAVLLLHAGAERPDEPVPLSSYIFPAAALLYCLGVFAIAGEAAQGGTAFTVYAVLASLGCAGAYAWVLWGPLALSVLLGQYRAPRRRPLPSREALLAAGPAHVPEADLARVAALRDPVLRNYLITQRYHDLSIALARAIAGPNANWCTFATWASKTAGESIRGEEVPEFVRELLRGEARLEAALRELAKEAGFRLPADGSDVFDLARATLARVEREVGDGNLKVFAELAPLFARFIDCFDDQDAIDDAAFARLLAGLRPGATADGGQDLLREAFTAYRDASREPDAGRRAEWMLLGNCLIGLHEQTRLQPNIARAMDAPVDVAASKGLLARLWSLAPSALRRDLDRLFGPSGELTLRLARAIWQRIATAAAMHLTLPDGHRIPLCEDVDLSLGDQRIPQALTAPTLPALRALIARFGAEPHAPHGQGAGDWADLDERMRFIVDLFRATQQDVRLLEQPFDPALRLEIETRYAAAQAALRKPEAVEAQ